jgi:hypothetical protein
MELAELRIDPGEARAKLDEYAAQVEAERTAEDRAIAMGYRAAARGLPLISLRETIAMGGYDRHGLPNLAICPAAYADQGGTVLAAECTVRWDGWSGDHLIYADRDLWGVNRGALVGRHSVRVQADDPPPARTRKSAGTTMVPLIPPRFRPKPRRLKHCHILWEVEEWTLVPPRDPALLRHVRGDLWAVLAVWDLTDLERHVLSQRVA